MASRRLLKKQITSIHTQLLDECIICNMLIKEFDDEKLQTLAQRIIDIHDDCRCRISNYERTADRKRVRHYFNTLIEDFNRETFDIIKVMNEGVAE